MITKITIKQSKQMNALIKKLCCNYVNENGLLLDDGEEHSCVQIISKSGIFYSSMKNTNLFRQTQKCSTAYCLTVCTYL